MTIEFPKEFTDFIQDKFGLEWIDYNDQLCYDEWCEMKKMKHS